jgi:hypothetical protein
VHHALMPGHPFISSRGLKVKDLAAGLRSVWPWCATSWRSMRRWTLMPSSGG